MTPNTAEPTLNTWKKRKLFSFRYVPRERRKAVILACVFFWSIISFFGIRYYLLGTVVVQGDSMKPTLVNGERRLIHRWMYFVRGPRRGEIVVLRDPTDKTLSVKRVIALPDEMLQIRDRRVFVNGRELRERYLEDGVTTHPHYLSDNVYAVNEGHYFVLGDNRAESVDSRHFGAVSRRDIIGRIRQPALLRRKE